MRANGGIVNAHISASGATHFGSRAMCATIECTPPSLPVREGDTVRVVIPDAGVDGHFIITSDPTSEDGAVTLALAPAAVADE